MISKLASLSHGMVLSIAALVAVCLSLFLYALVPSANVATGITAALALYGAAIATLNELRSASAKTRAMRFDCMFRINGREPRHAVFVLRFTNIAERPATVDAVELHADGRLPNVFVAYPAELGKAARKLSDGDFIVGEIDANRFSGTLKAAGWSGVATVTPVCFLSDGTKWKAPEMEFDCEHWPQEVKPPPPIVVV